MTHQRFLLDRQLVWEADSDATTPVYLAGPHLYAISTIGGAVAPFGEWHLQGLMGGVWAHPVRVLHGWSLLLEQGGRPGEELTAHTCDLFGSHVTRHYRAEHVDLTWTEFVPDQHAALAGVVTVHNSTAQPWNGHLLVQAELDMRGCWFGGWATPTLQIRVASDALLVSGDGGPFAERATIIQAAGATWRVAGTTATARIALALEPEAEITIPMLLAVVHHGGAAAAGALATEIRQASTDLFAAKQAATTTMLADVTLVTPDPALNRAWQVARLNFQALGASYPDLPRYFLAGLPEYPQLFGCDCEYTTPGALAAGFGATMLSTLQALASYGERACGRIPHEITTNARVFHPGNTQETPQFAVACWDYVRWTGDMAFLERVYPLCVEGLEHNRWSLQHGGYPLGDGVVERLGMGAAKLDSVCYLYQSLQALAHMAGVLGHESDAGQFGDWAATLRERFERDWWLEAEGMYADSLHLDGRPQFDGHWTVALPLQIGIASDERARRSLARIEREWVNEWGLVHTRGVEAQVWTLPTGLLALAAFRYGRPELGRDLLHNIALTAQHGTLGLLKELIPIGMCFVQLWSAGLLVQGLVEGLLGIAPLAHQHAIAIDPALPAEWSTVALGGLRVGDHLLDLLVGQHSATMTHRSGAVPISVQWRDGAPVRVEPGQHVTLGST